MYSHLPMQGQAYRFDLLGWEGLPTEEANTTVFTTWKIGQKAMSQSMGWMDMTEAYTRVYKTRKLW